MEATIRTTEAMTTMGTEMQVTTGAEALSYEQSDTRSMDARLRSL